MQSQLLFWDSMLRLCVFSDFELKYIYNIYSVSIISFFVLFFLIYPYTMFSAATYI